MTIDRGDYICTNLVHVICPFVDRQSMLQENDQRGKSGRNNGHVRDAAGDYYVVAHLQCASSTDISKHINLCNKIH